jgi:xanthine dehydrogenase accessory factor
MDAGDYRILIRGAGELASATAHHLYTQGFKRILMLDRRYPKAVRRKVCFCEAVLEGQQVVQGVPATLARVLDAVDEIHERQWRRS